MKIPPPRDENDRLQIAQRMSLEASAAEQRPMKVIVSKGRYGWTARADPLDPDGTWSFTKAAALRPRDERGRYLPEHGAPTPPSQPVTPPPG
jgi:hypothetical protein